MDRSSIIYNQFKLPEKSTTKNEGVLSKPQLLEAINSLVINTEKDKSRTFDEKGSFHFGYAKLPELFEPQIKEQTLHIVESGLLVPSLNLETTLVTNISSHDLQKELAKCQLPHLLNTEFSLIRCEI
jgi:hypothetical protein